MRTTVNLALTVWDDLDDPYDHNQLGANWDRLDQHDHSPTNGVQIPTAGIKDRAVTTIKLGLDSVTTQEILNHTILGEDMADGAVGLDQINQTVFETMSPLGQVISWFRPTVATAVPPGWVLAIGQTLNSTQHSWPVGGNITVPDLRNRFILGAATDGNITGSATNGPLEASSTSIQYGGSHTRSISHNHTVPAHTHTDTGHVHVQADHAHYIPSHNHTTDVAGGHSHGMYSRIGTFEAAARSFRDSTNTLRNTDQQSLYVASFNDGGINAPVPSDGAHAHTTTATSVVPTGSVVTPVATASGAASLSSVAQSTDTVNLSVDLRAQYVGLLYIIKVKYR
jgi:hypothetical protein